MNRIHYTVDGMSNSQNKTALKNALEKIDGVQMVNVDLGRGSVEVGYSEYVNENAIKSCIEHTGFTCS